MQDTYIIPKSLKGRETALIYTRVATKQQLKGSGLSGQRDLCTAFAEAAGLTVIAIHEEVLSGALYTARPVLQAVLRALEDKQAEVLIVKDMHALIQSAEYSATIKSRIEAAGAMLIMSEEHRIDSPLYNLARQLEAVQQDINKKRA